MYLTVSDNYRCQYQRTIFWLRRTYQQEDFFFVFSKYLCILYFKLHLYIFLYQNQKCEGGEPEKISFLFFTEEMWYIHVSHWKNTHTHTHTYHIWKEFLVEKQTFIKHWPESQGKVKSRPRSQPKHLKHQGKSRTSLSAMDSHFCQKSHKGIM